MSGPSKQIDDLLAQSSLNKKELLAFEKDASNWSQRAIEVLLENNILDTCSSLVKNDLQPSPQWEVALIVIKVLGSNENARTRARMGLVSKLSEALLTELRDVKAKKTAIRDKQLEYLESKGTAIADLCFDEKSSDLGWVDELVDLWNDALDEAMSPNRRLTVSHAFLCVILGITRNGANGQFTSLSSYIAKYLLRSGSVFLLHQLCLLKGRGKGKIAVAERPKGIEQMQGCVIVFLSRLVYNDSSVEPTFFSEHESKGMLHDAFKSKSLTLKVRALAFVSGLPCAIFDNFAEAKVEFQNPGLLDRFKKIDPLACPQCLLDLFHEEAQLIPGTEQVECQEGPGGEQLRWADGRGVKQMECDEEPGAEQLELVEDGGVEQVEWEEDPGAEVMEDDHGAQLNPGTEQAVLIEDPGVSGNEAGVSGNEAGVSGNEAGVSGDEAGVSGDEAGVSGDAAGVSGDAAGVSGDAAGVSGDAAGVSGDAAGVLGDDAGESGNDAGESGSDAGESGNDSSAMEEPYESLSADQQELDRRLKAGQVAQPQPAAQAVELPNAATAATPAIPPPAEACDPTPSTMGSLATGQHTLATAAVAAPVGPQEGPMPPPPHRPKRPRPDAGTEQNGTRSVNTRLATSHGSSSPHSPSGALAEVVTGAQGEGSLILADIAQCLGSISDLGKARDRKLVSMKNRFLDVNRGLLDGEDLDISVIMSANVEQDLVAMQNKI
eukprot:gene18138-24578_t